MVLLHRQFGRFTVALLLVFISTSTSEKGSPFILQFILEATGIAQCLKCGVPSPQSGRGNTTFRTLGLFIYNWESLWKGRELTVRFCEQASMVLIHRQFERYTIALLLVFIIFSDFLNGSVFIIRLIVEATDIAQCLKCEALSPQSGGGNATILTIGLFIYNFIMFGKISENLPLCFFGLIRGLCRPFSL